MIALRGIAIALAVFAIVDPRIAWPRRERPPVRVLGTDADVREQLVARLAGAGFPSAADKEAATIAADTAVTVPSRLSTPLYVVTSDAAEPDVTMLGASAPATRVAQQAVSVSFVVRARGGRGATTAVRLEDGGLTVASASHQWTADDDTWRTTLSYLPAASGPLRLRVRADALPGERHTADNTADVLAPAMRGPIRTLVLEPAVTWPAAFVRRALEGAPGFAVSAVQRATRAVATRAGSPPRSLSEAELAPYEVVVVGQPVSLDAAALESLRWFVERRGGVAVFVPDQAPKGTFGGLLRDVSFEPKSLDRPVSLSGNGAGLVAAELAVPRGLPTLAVPLATDSTGTPIVFAVRRGLGSVIVSGALDAWRYRDRDDASFARFWQATVMQQAGVVPPRLEVTASPSLARPGDPVRVTVRLRDTELPEADRIVLPSITLRAVNPRTRRETPVRLWPSGEPGVFEGDWRAAEAGDYVLDASIATADGATGAAGVMVAADVVAAAPGDEGLAMAAHASGGRAVKGEDALLRTLDARFPPALVTRPSHPARSLWYAAGFAVLLCGEWALRRRRGLR